MKVTVELEVEINDGVSSTDILDYFSESADNYKECIEIYCESAFSEDWIGEEL